MKEYVKNFIMAFAEDKGIAVEQLVTIELGQKIKYMYLEENAVHLVEEQISVGDINEPTE